MAFTEDKLEIDEKMFGQKTILIAKSGYGKSYSARVLIEEGIEKGNTFIIIDPQEAYWNLVGFEYVKATQVKSPRKLGILLSQTNKNIVISTKDLMPKEANIFLNGFLNGYKQNIRKGIQTIVLDEMHKFAPEGEKTIAKDNVRACFQENRSDGLGFIGISQRPARIDKTVISQADNLMIGRVTSVRDCQAVQNYIDNVEDIKQIKTLKVGEFYLNGFGLDQPEVHQIRKAKTEHSGTAPTNLLTEDTDTYNKYKNKIIRGKNMENVSTAKEPIKKIIPSVDGFMDLAKIGAEFSLGAVASGMVGKYASAVPNIIPVVSNQTLGSGVTTIALYAGYRNVKNPLLKDIFKYGSAGSAVRTAGSLFYDVVVLTGVQLPPIITMAVNAGTGVAPVVSSAPKIASGKGAEKADVNTEFSY